MSFVEREASSPKVDETCVGHNFGLTTAMGHPIAVDPAYVFVTFSVISNRSAPMGA